MSTAIKSPSKLAAWLLFDVLDCGTVGHGNGELLGDAEGDDGVIGEAHTALAHGDIERAVELLREAVRLAGEPLPEIKDGRNRAERQHRAQDQRERLLNVAQIALTLLEQPAAAPVAPSPAPAPTVNLMAAADAAEAFARALRAAAGQEGGAA